MLCFDPTRGIDVGTKRQIYALLRELADDGAAILFFSSELAEFPLVCDRVLTLYGGAVTAELPARAADEATLLRAMHGLVEERGRHERDAGGRRRRRGRSTGAGSCAATAGRSASTCCCSSLDPLLALDDDGCRGGRSTCSRSCIDALPLAFAAMRAGDRDHLRRDRPLGRLADEPDQRRRGEVDART